MKKVIIFLGIVAVFLIITIVAIGNWVISNEPSQKIIFSNNSDNSITSTKIKYCNKALNLSEIKSQESVSRHLERAGDCSFDLKITFSDGSVIEENNLGYITSGDGSKSIFIVTGQQELDFSQEY